VKLSRVHAWKRDQGYFRLNGNHNEGRERRGEGEEVDFSAASFCFEVFFVVKLNDLWEKVRRDVPNRRDSSSRHACKIWNCECVGIFL
jgi:hypothetical protein